MYSSNHPRPSKHHRYDPARLVAGGHFDSTSSSSKNRTSQPGSSSSMNNSPAALLIDLTRSPSPKIIDPPTSPSFEIPSVFQQLRSRNFCQPGRLNSPLKRKKSAIHPGVANCYTSQSNNPLSKRKRLRHLEQSRQNDSPDQITLCSDPIDLTLDEDNLGIRPNPTAPTCTSSRKSTAHSSSLKNCSEPIDLTLDDEDVVTTQNNLIPSSNPIIQQPDVVQNVVDPPVSLCSSQLSSCSSDAELVESILLHRPPLESSLPKSPSPLPKSPPPLRFLPSDLKFLNIYLCKPISRVLTTCSSIIIPPQPIPGFPLNRLEKTYLKDDWRIKRELIRCPGSSSSNVDCWISGFGWPAKSFIICGWLVGIDRREKFLSYYIDDGTAVVECQVLISQLNKVFDLSTETMSKTTGKEEKQSAEAPKHSCVETSLDQGENHPPSKPKADPRLDPYRRLPSPIRKSHASSSKTGSKNDSSLQNKQAEKIEVTEELISKYSNLNIGITLKLIGQPKELFNNSKRILDLEKVVIIHENFENDHDEEIQFRNQLKHYRNHVYNEPFRLSNAWPQSTELFKNQSSQKPDTSQVSNEKHQTVVKEKEAKRLKLVPISKLKPSQITFVNYVNYLTHHIITTYGDDTSKMISYQDLKERISKSENVNLFEEFFIKDIFGNPDPDKNKNDQHPRIEELNQFMEKLIAQQQQQSQVERAQEKKEKRSEGMSSKPAKSIFLTQEEEFRTGKKALTREAIIKKSLQALLNQGTIIISPHNEAGFTVPNVYSLGPKIVQILTNNLPSSSTKSDSTTSSVSSNFILNHLQRDQLWKSVALNQVETTLQRLGFKQIEQHSWSLLF